MTTTRETFCFGEFELDVDAGELRRKNRRLKLQPQPFKLLLLLVRKAGTLVSRDEIRRELWPDGTFVDFDQSVNFSIKQIRDVLGDDADRPLCSLRPFRSRGPSVHCPNLHSGHQPAPIVLSDGGDRIRLEKALVDATSPSFGWPSRGADADTLGTLSGQLSVLLVVTTILLFLR